MLRNLLLISALVIAIEPLLAATPESGTITDSQKTVEWAGGPFIVPNVSPTLGLADQEPVCEEGTEVCDVYRFEVNLSNANLDEDTVVVTVGWEGATDVGGLATVPDYDLYLYDDSTGDLIVDQASAANPEIITLPAENRKYRLVIIPFAPMDTVYAGKVTYVPFEEEKSLGILGGAFGAGTLLLLTGFGVLARKRRVG